MAMQYAWISELKPGDEVHYAGSPGRVIQVIQGSASFALVLDQGGNEFVYEGLRGDREVLRVEPTA